MKNLPFSLIRETGRRGSWLAGILQKPGPQKAQITLFLGSGPNAVQIAAV